MCKVVNTIKESIKLCGLEDGMTISFHHCLRSGDRVAAQIFSAIAELGIRDLTIAPSSLLPGHDALIPYIEDGTISRIQTSGVTPTIGRLLQSKAPLGYPVEMRTHGSRCSALEKGDIDIDVAFIAASRADKYGNCNGSTGHSAFGSMGYSMVDARYAKKVVVITDELSDLPVLPVSISQSDVNYVVKVDCIGDPSGIATASLAPSKNPIDRCIAELTARLIICSGRLFNGCRMQTGAGKISLSVVPMLEDYMRKNGICADFAMGGMTGMLVDLMKKGLISSLYDTQSFDLTAAASIGSDPRHVEVSAQSYADPDVKGGAIVNELDFTILGATEIDTEFNVNVVTDSNNRLISGAGGHGDSADGAKLAIITAPLYRSKYPSIVDKVNAVCTPGRCIDAFVCEKGIAINTQNPKNADLQLMLKDAGLPVKTIHELKYEAEKYTGKLPPVEKGDRIVANVLWRDGSVLDTIKMNIE